MCGLQVVCWWFAGGLPEVCEGKVGLGWVSTLVPMRYGVYVR